MWIIWAVLFQKPGLSLGLPLSGSLRAVPPSTLRQAVSELGRVALSRHALFVKGVMEDPS